MCKCESGTDWIRFACFYKESAHHRFVSFPSKLSMEKKLSLKEYPNPKLCVFLRLFVRPDGICCMPLLVLKFFTIG